MRRERRLKSKSLKFLYVSATLLIILSISLVILYRVYNKKLSEISDSMLDTETIMGLVPNNMENVNEQTESASTLLSKTIEEVTQNNKTETEEDSKETENITTAVEEAKQEVEPKKELSFIYPVEGEISKKFAMDELIYSDTLEEWTIHQGMDIKADRTTVVKASEEGTIVAIKNDPRYGLTVIIEHQDGFKTVYSNLLTTEFVSEDEKVEKGQSIGTVGNSAVFEIADEPHLHFEIIKDGEYVDPQMYLK